MRAMSSRLAARAAARWWSRALVSHERQRRTRYYRTTGSGRLTPGKPRTFRRHRTAALRARLRRWGRSRSVRLDLGPRIPSADYLLAGPCHTQCRHRTRIGLFGCAAPETEWSCDSDGWRTRRLRLVVL